MPNDKPLKPNDFPVEVEGEGLVTADGKPIAKAKTPAIVEDIADRSLTRTITAKSRTDGRLDLARGSRQLGSLLQPRRFLKPFGSPVFACAERKEAGKIFHRASSRKAVTEYEKAQEYLQYQRLKAERSAREARSPKRNSARPGTRETAGIPRVFIGGLSRQPSKINLRLEVTSDKCLRWALTVLQAVIARNSRLRHDESIAVNGHAEQERNRQD